MRDLTVREVTLAADHTSSRITCLEVTAASRIFSRVDLEVIAHVPGDPSRIVHHARLSRVITGQPATTAVLAANLAHGAPPSAVDLAVRAVTLLLGP